MKTLYDLSEAELDAFLADAKRSLADQAGELRWSREPGDVRAAMETTISLLRELGEARPELASVIALILGNRWSITFCDSCFLYPHILDQ